MANPPKLPDASLFERLATDDWFISHSVTDPAIFHALGVLAWAWSACETANVNLFHKLSGAPLELSFLLIGDQGADWVQKRIRSMADYMMDEGDEDHDLLVNVYAVFEKCRINRNTLTHYKIQLDDKGQFRMVRLKSAEKSILPDSLSDVRRVADECLALAKWLNDVCCYFEALSRALPATRPSKVIPPELLYQNPHARTQSKQPKHGRPSAGSPERR